MPQSIKGTIHIDMAELATLVQQLKQIKNALDTQKHHIALLQNGLDQAISGTAVNISSFDNRFDQWLKMLGSVITDMDIAYATLNVALAEAQENDITGVIAALNNGAK